ncbi:casein kinase I [Entophlyctis sp. JEL0112]|nr:casein kinase I [Entophlyctis sp. JEL0112]
MADVSPNEQKQDFKSSSAEPPPESSPVHPLLNPAATTSSPTSSTQPLVARSVTNATSPLRPSVIEDLPKQTRSEVRTSNADEHQANFTKATRHASQIVPGHRQRSQESREKQGKSPSQVEPPAGQEKSSAKNEVRSPTQAKTPSAKSSLSANNNIIGTHYKVGKKIGEGSFGVIYEGLNMLTNAPIAIKFEPRKSDAPQLRDEYKTYRLLAGSVGIPSAYYFGQEGLHNVLCIDLLGPSLEDMFDLCHRKFSVKTVCMVAKQMITRVQTIHEKNLIYRDIKPDNFLIGRLSRHEPSPILQSHSATQPHSASMVYMVDFGMAKQYRDPKTKAHIPYREKKSLSGTARYMSINTHLGREQSRRDDLEALGHVFFYLLRGSLPWQGLKAATNKQKYEKIGEKKQTTPIPELCEGLPEEFSIYQNYARDLKFDEQPDYEYLKGLLNKVLAKNGFIDDGIYDWMIELDYQRVKKERQRATESTSQRKPAEASTAAIAYQSTVEGLTMQSNNAVAGGSTLPRGDKKIEQQVVSESPLKLPNINEAALADDTKKSAEKDIRKKSNANSKNKEEKVGKPDNPGKEVVPPKGKTNVKKSSFFSELCACCRT